jgi:hypothetical protein
MSRPPYFTTYKSTHRCSAGTALNTGCTLGRCCSHHALFWCDETLTDRIIRAGLFEPSSKQVDACKWTGFGGLHKRGAWCLPMTASCAVSQIFFCFQNKYKLFSVVFVMEVHLNRIILRTKSHDNRCIKLTPYNLYGWHSVVNHSSFTNGTYQCKPLVWILWCLSRKWKNYISQFLNSENHEL